MHSLVLRCLSIIDINLFTIALYLSDVILHYCLLYNCSLLQKKALLHKTFFSLRRGSVTLWYLCVSYFVYLVSD